MSLLPSASASLAASAKKGTLGFMGALASLGITPDDVSLGVAIAIGLVGGTAAAWTRERQNGKHIPKNWLLLQAAAYIMIFVLVLALNEWPGLTVRWSSAVAALLSFASREGLTAMHKRTLKEIAERKAGD